MKVIFRPVLLTTEAIKLDDWNRTEWFGIDWPYVPYWDALEEHSAYGVHDGNSIDFEIGNPFEYIAIYLAGEFLCSFELGNAYEAPCVMTLKGISFIKDQTNALCPLQRPT